MLVNQSIQNVARVTGYVAEQTDSEYLRRAQQIIWHLAVRWKQTRKLIIKLYFMKRRDEPLKEKAIRRMRDILDEFRMIVGTCYLWDARISDLGTQDEIFFHTCIGQGQKDNVACDGQEIRLAGEGQTGSGYCGIAIMDENLYLYRQEYRIPAGNVTSLVLPLNPSIHIFAITLVYFPGIW